MVCDSSHPHSLSSTQEKLNVVPQFKTVSMIRSYSDKILLYLLSTPPFYTHMHPEVSGMTAPNVYHGYYFQEVGFQVFSLFSKKKFSSFIVFILLLKFIGIQHVHQKSHHSE